MVIGNRRELASLDKPPRRRGTIRSRWRRHTQLGRPGDDIPLPGCTAPDAERIPYIDDNRLVMGDVVIRIDHRTECSRGVRLLTDIVQLDTQVDTGEADTAPIRDLNLGSIGAGDVKDGKDEQAP